MFFVFLGIALADLLFLATWIALGFGVGGDAARFLTHQVGGLMVAISLALLCVRDWWLAGFVSSYFVQFPVAS